MNIRTQVTISAEDHARAQGRAAERGVSFAEYIRTLVRRDLGDEPGTRAGVEELFGIGDSGGSDVARQKDHYIGEAVAAAKAANG